MISELLKYDLGAGGEAFSTRREPENIQVCGIDTFTDESFFSARREGVECGRIINSIKLV